MKKRIQARACVLFLVHMHAQCMKNELPPGLCLILPPAETYSQATGLPAGTMIVLPKELQEHIPHERLVKAITLIKNNRYAQAAAELHAIKELSGSNTAELTALKRVLEVAIATSDDQQEKIWEITNFIGLQNICFLLLHEPLKNILPTPPNTELALCCSTTYLMCMCCLHAHLAQPLKTIQKYLETTPTVPPMYTVRIPPLAIAMKSENASSTKISELLTSPAIAMTKNTPALSAHVPALLALESGVKKEYDGCRIRTRLQQKE